MRFNLYGCSFAAFIFLSVAASPNADAAYPDRPITLIVPFAPGGANDAIARVVARVAGAALGQPIIIDNKGGAGGTIGTDVVARAKPDGYTLLLASAAHSINSLVYSNLQYDPIKDFVPVIQLAESPYVLVVGKPVAAKSLKALISLAASNPEQYTYASSGTGSAPHLAGAMLGDMSTVALRHIPYKGGGPALMDVARGDVTMYFSSLAAALPFLQAGTVRPFAVSTSKRSSALPDVPTVAEAGVPGFEFVGWYGILAPAAAPPEVIRKLNEVFADALKNPAVMQQFAMEGNTAIGGSPEKLGTLIKGDLSKFAKFRNIIKAN